MNFGITRTPVGRRVAIVFANLWSNSVKKLSSQAEERRFVIQLLFVAGFALALRLTSLIELEGSPLLSVLLGDGKAYDAWAQQIAGGDWTGSGTFYQSPLYPYFLALVYKTAGHHPTLVRLLQVFCGASACVLLGLAGRRFFNKSIGLVAASLLAIYPPAIFFDVLIQKSSLDSLFVSGSLLALGSFIDRQRVQWLLLLGILLGLFMLNRENARILYPIVVIWLIFGFRRSLTRTRLGWAATFTVGAALVLAPVAIRNYYVGGEFLLSTSQLGPNFYIGNHANASGTYEPLIPDRGNVDYERIDATQLAEAASGRSLSSGEVSSYWLNQSLAYIRSEPVKWLGLTARKFTLTLNAHEAVDTESIEAYSEYSLVLRIFSWFNFGIVFPLSVLGVWLTRRSWRRVTILYAFVIGMTCSVILFYVMARYRYPIVPMLLLFAAVPLTSVLELKRKGMISWLPGLAIAVVCGILAYLPLSLPADNMKIYLGSELVRMGEPKIAVQLLRQAIDKLPDYAPAHFSLALALSQLDEHESALEEYRTTVRLWPGDFKAQEALALALQSSRCDREALDHFRAAERLQPESVAAQNNLAMALHQAGQPIESIEHYEAALRIAPDYAEGHSNLAMALAETGRGNDAVDHYKQALIIQPSNIAIHVNLANLLLELNRFPESIAHYEQAVSLMPDSPDIQGRLAQAYLKNGRFRDAVERFKLAITVARNAGDVAEAEALAESMRACEARFNRP